MLSHLCFTAKIQKRLNCCGKITASDIVRHWGTAPIWEHLRPGWGVVCPVFYCFLGHHVPCRMIQKTRTSQSLFDPAANLLWCVWGIIFLPPHILLPCSSTSWMHFKIAVVDTIWSVIVFALSRLNFWRLSSPFWWRNLFLAEALAWYLCYDGGRATGLDIIGSTLPFFSFCLRTTKFLITQHHTFHFVCIASTKMANPLSDVVWKYANSSCSDFNDSILDAKLLLLHLIASPRCGI